MLRLHQLTEIPDGLLDLPATELHTILPGPALLHLTGRHPEPLLVSVLLHGNETTGLTAIQQLLRKYREQTLPRALSLFFGNVEAARHGVRRLDTQPDYNRMWDGTALPECAETRAASQVVEIMRARNVFASVDLHNNTGLNPHYACVNSLENPHLQLASLFGRTVVYFQTPRGTLSAAFTPHCPSVTLECGRPGEARGIAHAEEFVEACLHLSEIPRHAVSASDLHLFHTVAQVRVPDDVRCGFDPSASDLVLIEDLERMNFQEMPEGTVFGTCRAGSAARLLVADDAGRDVTHTYFVCDEQAIVLRREVMPSMLTSDLAIIRQDCLCYLMERLPLPAAEDGRIRG